MILSEKPMVSVISVNYNQAKVTLDMIRTVMDSDYSEIEIIIVDNASIEDPTELIKATYPDVKVIRSKVNLGFAGGNNLGIRQASGEFMFFLNNDTEIKTDTIQILTETLIQKPEIGGVCPKILYYDEPDTIQFAGFTKLNPITLRNKTIGEKEKDLGQHDIPGNIHYMHGAAMMIRREAIEKAGEMPEIYFLYYEELDWSERIKDQGFKLYYQPDSKIYHKESLSVGKLSDLKLYYMTRNRLLFARRNLSLLSYSAFFLYMTFIVFPQKSIFGFLKSGSSHSAKIMFKGLVKHFSI